MRVAFQGETGAFSEEAALALHPGAEAVALPSFEAVFAAVTEGRVDRAVIPIENSLFGGVHVNYDLLREHDLVIGAEYNLRIRHCLMVQPGVRLTDVRRVMSHPQALGQCRQYLREHLRQAEEVQVYDTAGAAKMLAHSGARDEAAIASEKAAAQYGLEVLAHGIESNHRNYTRFLTLGTESAPRPSDPTARREKTSIVYSMQENVPGALFKSLAVFALRDIDLFKIESRPLIGSPGSYLFYLDVAGHQDDEPVRNALGHLREIASYLKVLGSYLIAPPISYPD
jgi:prephenate dehydratase